MRAVVQRVARAQVRVGGVEVSTIGMGVLVLVGVAAGDTEQDARLLARKVLGLRIFPDNAGVMNRSVEESNGEILAVSQFTLLGDVRRGRRPSYAAAASAEDGERLYGSFCAALREGTVPVREGQFQAHMAVELVNDGPVTILLDSKRAF